MGEIANWTIFQWVVVGLLLLILFRLQFIAWGARVISKQVRALSEQVEDGG